MWQGLLGDMFDFDRDGSLDAIEMAAEHHFLNKMLMKDDDLELDSLNDIDDFDDEADDELEYLDQDDF